MNPEVKTKWIAALRSGEYNQGRNTLRDWSNNFCCLGVLCDLHAKETGKEWTGQKEPAFHNKYMGYKYLGHSGNLAKDVIIWAGLEKEGETVSVPYGKAFKSLTVMNDRGMSFSQIADIIESEL